MPVSTLPESTEIEQPLLALLSDGKEHRWRDIVSKLADHYSLTNRTYAASIFSIGDFSC